MRVARALAAVLAALVSNVAFGQGKPAQDVRVTNTPLPVNVTNLPGANWPVLVNNTAASPVPVKMTTPTRYTVIGECQMPNSCVVSGELPTNTVFIVESISFRMTVYWTVPVTDIGGPAAVVTSHASNGSSGTAAYFACQTYISNLPSSKDVACNYPITLNLIESFNWNFWIEASVPPTGGTAYISMHGYLVPGSL